MAASGSTPSVSIASTTVPEDFHYETKYIVLSYLGMLPVKSRGQATGQGDAETDRERSSLIKADIGEALRQLEDEITSSFSTTGFDRRSSLVFNPASPESSVEDCLAAAGDRVAKELDTRLAQVVGELLSGPLDYQRFRDATLSLSAHTQEGWNKVLVPLVLLQALQSEGQSLATLLQLGLRFLEENESNFILQQGGWSDVFRLQPEDHQGVTIAEDSNDIYILSGEQHPEQPSPPSSLLCAGDTSSEQSSWQTESLPASLAGHESWAQVGGMDPEDAKSLDSAEGGALAEERSENNSSNSDIVHVEREEAELLEEAGEVEAIDESMMSVLGTESELAQLREELQEHAPPAPGSTEATEPASLLSLEEPGTVETVSVSLSAEPSLVTSEPELLLLPSLVTSEPELLLPPGSDAAETSSVEPEPAVPPSAPAMEPEPEPEPEQEAEPAVAPVPEAAEAAPPSLAKETAAAPAELEATSEPAPELKVEPVSLPPHSDPETVAEPEVPQAVASVTEVPVEAPSAEPSVQTESAPEFQLLLYGGATLAALAAVILYSVVSYRRK